MTVWFTSDTHFSDPRVLRIDRRPYPDLAVHDAALIANWNAVVAPGDTVWHLGDVALRPAPGRISEILTSLKGTKHLIVGNNDGPETLHAPGWASVGHYAEIVVDERPLVLCHYAFRTWNGMGRGALDLHGHSHAKLTPIPKQYDVGVDAQGFTPVDLPTILASRRARKVSSRKAEPSP
ncbi:metallophosphoesterase [Methylobacterium sp. Leaf469]|uniref:metallophosphoesterase n=1 Tax=unclassified Methylobacterium TaxID=2615210 RepID=UPI0006FE42F5|nr:MULTISPECIES: metallophosphoesterase [unclassified Methylobacterium]KQP34375.1 metallophosphoesterase [Methylobacterium sp. Leaf102]KQP72269.1 metallophosphoesterase [Methylobacterium sp. Leaf112]KQU05453.1 metallophosphoesterase [Methylobacterium sp. Leaf469]